MGRGFLSAKRAAREAREAEDRRATNAAFALAIELGLRLLEQDPARRPAVVSSVARETEPEIAPGNASGGFASGRVKLDEVGLARVDALAAHIGIDRAEVARIAFDVGIEEYGRRRQARAQ